MANSPSFEDKAVLEFFEASGRNLLAAEAAAGVGHHVALSVVGTDRLRAGGYFRKDGSRKPDQGVLNGPNLAHAILTTAELIAKLPGV